MLATPADVEARLARPLTTAEAVRVDGLLPEASALVVGYLGCDPTDPAADPTVPAAVTLVVSRMVARVLDREATAGEALGAESVTETAGPFGRTLNFGAGAASSVGGPWLAATDKITLKPYRCGGGVVSIGVTSGRTGRYRTATDVRR